LLFCLVEDEEEYHRWLGRRLTDVAFLRYGSRVDALEPERIAGYAELSR
jgi:hypothetical protein